MEQMKAKYIYESVSDVLVPKTEEQMHQDFREKMKMSWDKYVQYAEELKKLGIKINELWSWRINKMEIETYKAFAENWNIGTAMTKEDALAMIQAHKQYSYENHTYKIEPDHAYVDPRELKRLILKLSMRVNQSTKYVSDKTSSIRNKHDYPEYDEWFTKNHDKIVKRWKQESEEEDQIDESVTDVLKPKSEEDVRKNWPNKDISYDKFMNVKKRLEELGVNVRAIKPWGFGGNAYYYDVAAFGVLRGNVQFIRTLRLEDAKNLIRAMKKIEYSKTEYFIDDKERTMLDYSEAVKYLKKNEG
jgi:hypothetical protein